MRKNYIDNLRWFDILLLFPYHIFTLYNNWGENYYVRGAENAFLSLFVRFCQPWFMPLLFVLAGISAVYALSRRTPAQYVQERCKKLLLPFVSGVLLIVPVLTYFAERFHNGYTGGYLKQYILFFTKTDLVGYTGGFTPAHLWFILYLFVISLAALPLVLWWKKSRFYRQTEKIPVWGIAAMFLVVWAMRYILDINGKSIGRYLALWMLGAVVLSWDSTQNKLERNCLWLTAIWLTLSAARLLCVLPGGIDDGLTDCVSWMGVLAIMGLGKRYFNRRSRIGDYFSRASFTVYIVHLPWIIVFAFYFFRVTASVPLQVILITICSFAASILSYEIMRRFPVTRMLFGIKDIKRD